VFDPRGIALMVVHLGDAVHLDVERSAQMCDIKDLLVKTRVQLPKCAYRSRRHHGDLGSCFEQTAERLLLSSIVSIAIDDSSQLFCSAQSRCSLEVQRVIDGPDRFSCVHRSLPDR
jgi:hypothetical protein